MADFIGGFFRCECGKLHTVDGAAMTGHTLCPNCGRNLSDQAWAKGKTVKSTTSRHNW